MWDSRTKAADDMLSRVMSFHLFSLQLSLAAVLFWMLLFAAPLIWLNDYLKRRSAATMEVDSEALSRFG